MPRPALAPGLQPQRLPAEGEHQTVYGMPTISGCCVVLECPTLPEEARTEQHRGARNSCSVLRHSISLPGSTGEAETQIAKRLPDHILSWSLLSPSGRAEGLMEDVPTMLPLSFPHSLSSQQENQEGEKEPAAAAALGPSVNTLS